jgi:spermidine synthase
MWDEYFINSKVYGIDITDLYIKDLIKENKYNIIIGNACSEEILNQLNDLTFDVIIDDGSHLINDQINSFNILKDRMKPNGIYIIEDVNNLDSTIDIYKNLHNNIEIIDNRHIKNRIDDVLVVYKF